MELWQLDATDLARLIRTGRASAREAVESCLARMDAVNPAINAVVRRMDDEARAAADAADAARARGEALGPLHGVPVTTKVNVDQKGHPTDNGIVAYKDLIAAEDSPVVANLKHAGAIIIGRTNAPAFSMRMFTDNALHGRTLNPLDPAVTPGGSSGGAGAAVATGIGAIAHGNDIGGSVRIPANCCGVVGLRTAFGRVPAFNPSAPGGRPLGGQLMSVQGPHTRTVRDTRLALAAMARGDRRDWKWADMPLVGPAPDRPIRVALVPEVPGGTTHGAQAAAVREAGKHLQAAGYVVDEVQPPDIAQVIELWHRICLGDVFNALWPLMQQLGDPDGRASIGGLAVAVSEGRIRRVRRGGYRSRCDAAALAGVVRAVAAAHHAGALRSSATAARRRHTGWAAPDSRTDARFAGRAVAGVARARRPGATPRATAHRCSDHGHPLARGPVSRCG